MVAGRHESLLHYGQLRSLVLHHSINPEAMLCSRNSHVALETAPHAPHTGGDFLFIGKTYYEREYIPVPAQHYVQNIYVLHVSKLSLFCQVRRYEAVWGSRFTSSHS